MEAKIYRRIKLQQTKRGKKAEKQKNMPKINTQVALGDAITTILKKILTTTLTINPDNHDP